MNYKYVYKNGYRYYDIDGKYYAGVTSVTKQISPFKDSKHGPAAHIGTLAHMHILKNYSKEPLYLPKDMIWNVPEWEVQDKIMNAIKMWKDLDLKYEFIDIESLILNHEYCYAGRTDFTCLDENGVFSVGDIKTGMIYDDYYPQIAAYCKAVGAEQGILVQLDLNHERNKERKGKLIIMDKEKIDKSFEQFLELLERFNNDNG